MIEFNIEERVPLSDSRRVVMRSETLGRPIVLDICNVGGALNVDRPKPVVYLLDGNGLMGMTAGAARTMVLERLIPPCVVVGLGYESEDFSTLGQLRDEDLTPTRDPERAAVAGDPNAPSAGGGGTRFLDALRSEVVPLIERELPADPERRVLLGFSLGGLFTLSAMLAHPSAFHAYVAGSPSLWWDNRYLFRAEADYARSHDDLPARLFLSVGGLESRPHPLANAEQNASLLKSRMVENLEEFAGTLSGRGYPSLELTSHVFPDETHTSVLPATLSRGLRASLAR